MKIPAYVLIFSGFFWITACERKECQSPPPSIRLLLIQPDGSNAITTDNAGRVNILHTNNGKLIPIGNYKVGPPAAYTIETYEMNIVSRQFADTTHFYINVDDKPFGVVQLKTYVDNGRCDGWTHVNELKFNGRVVPYDNMKPGYMLTP